MEVKTWVCKLSAKVKIDLLSIVDHFRTPRQGQPFLEREIENTHLPPRLVDTWQIRPIYAPLFQPKFIAQERRAWWVYRQISPAASLRQRIERLVIKGPINFLIYRRIDYRLEPLDCRPGVMKNRLGPKRFFAHLLFSILLSNVVNLSV